MFAIAIALVSISAADTDANLANLAPLAAAIAKADRATLFEGLPHQSHEKELLEAELKSRKVVKLHDFPFYAETLPLKPGDGRALIDLAAKESSYQKWAGAKRCGGFHPDYLVEFAVGKETYRMQVCFGCQEVKLFGPKSEVFVDMSDDGLHGLEKILKGYRKNRPKE